MKYELKSMLSWDQRLAYLETETKLSPWRPPPRPPAFCPQIQNKKEQCVQSVLLLRPHHLCAHNVKPWGGAGQGQGCCLPQQVWEGRMLLKSSNHSPCGEEGAGRERPELPTHASYPGGRSPHHAAGEKSRLLTGGKVGYRPCSTLHV